MSPVVVFRLVQRRRPFSFAAHIPDFGLKPFYQDEIFKRDFRMRVAVDWSFERNRNFFNCISLQLEMERDEEAIDMRNVWVELDYVVALFLSLLHIV